jgi:hypothetical protein
MMTRGFDRFITQFDADSSLSEPDQLRKRLELLDALDAHFGNLDAESLLAATDRPRIFVRANLLRNRLESANAAIYNAIRDQVLQGASPSRLRQWIERCSDDGKTQPGLGYDHLDELISGVLQTLEPEIKPIHLPPEMVFYQPTPARHILQLIRLSALTAADTLVDLGSGLGHVPILASILTGAQAIGIEAESAYVKSARECARSLHLKRVTFVHQNASVANLAGGTVFYLYTPFTGNTLKTVLQKLQKESAERPITICTLGPCTSTVAMEQWLTAGAVPDPDQITAFRSKP